MLNCPIPTQVRCTVDACALETRRRFVTEQGKKKQGSRNLNPGLNTYVIGVVFKNLRKINAGRSSLKYA